MLEGRYGLARGIYNRLRVDGRFVVRTILDDVQYRLNAMPNHGGSSAYLIESGADRRGFIFVKGK